MKKISLLALPLVLLAATASVDEKIETLENEIKQLKKEMLYHQEDLDERMPIIEKIERKSILDKINLSPEILLRFDKFDYNNRSIEGEKTLENEIKQLKKEMLYHQEDLDERMPIIEKIERKSILDKINLSPEILLRFDKFDYNNRSIEGEKTLI